MLEEEQPEQEELEQEEPGQEEEERQTPKMSKWACPECGNKLTLYLTPSISPTCQNPQSHPKKVVQMEKK